MISACYDNDSKSRHVIGSVILKLNLSYHLNIKRGFKHKYKHYRVIPLEYFDFCDN